jgi:hypothetical protein
LCLSIGRNRFGDRRLKQYHEKKSQQHRSSPKVESSKTKSVIASSFKTLGRPENVRSSIHNNCFGFSLIPVGSALSDAEDRLLKTGRVTPRISSPKPCGSKPDFEERPCDSLLLGHLHGTSVPPVSHIGTSPTDSDWVSALEEKYLKHCGNRLQHGSFIDMFEPRPIEEMNYDNIPRDISLVSVSNW